MQILPFNQFSFHIRNGIVWFRLTAQALRSLSLLCGEPVKLHSYYPRHLLDLRGNKCVVMLPRIITVPADEEERPRTHMVLCDFILKFKRYTTKSFLLACRLFASLALERDIEFDRLAAWFEARYPRIARYLRRMRASFSARLRESGQALVQLEKQQPCHAPDLSPHVALHLPSDTPEAGTRTGVCSAPPSPSTGTVEQSLSEAPDQDPPPRGVFRLLRHISVVWKSVPQALAKYFFCKQDRYPVEVRLWVDHRLAPAPP